MGLVTQKNGRKAGRPVDPRKGEGIINAARHLVFSEGPQALTMERVAQEAGVSKVTLYARFANRHELLSAVVAGDANTIYQSLGAVPATRAALHADLCVFIRVLKRFICGEHYQRLIVIMGSIPQNNKDLEAVYRNGPGKTHQVLTDYLAAAAGAGLIDCPRPVDSAELLMGMVQGLDLLRSTYRVPVQECSPGEAEAIAMRIASAFITMHTAPAG